MPLLQGPSVRILHAGQILIIQNACKYMWYVPCAWQRESLWHPCKLLSSSYYWLWKTLSSICDSLAWGIRQIKGRPALSLPWAHKEAMLASLLCLCCRRCLLLWKACLLTHPAIASFFLRVFFPWWTWETSLSSSSDNVLDRFQVKQQTHGLHDRKQK